MKNTMDVKIVTPEGVFREGVADMIELPTETGELGVYPGHIPLITEIAVGQIRLHKGTEVDYLAVAGGFAQIDQESVHMLALFAASEEEGEIIEAACERARKALTDTATLSKEEIERDIAQLRAACADVQRLRKGRRQPPPQAMG